MDKSIKKFIKSHHVLTLATVSDCIPYTSNMFYAFDAENISIIFSSQENTKHIQDSLKNEMVGINIVLETKIVGKVCGLQGLGVIRRAVGDDLKRIKSIYIKCFPYTALMDLTLWIVDFNSIKFTDNKLGFGKKLIWNRGD